MIASGMPSPPGFILHELMHGAGKAAELGRITEAIPKEEGSLCVDFAFNDLFGDTP